MAHLVPGKHLVFRQSAGIPHRALEIGADLFIDIVAHQQVGAIALGRKPAQSVQHLGVGIVVQPVVAVHHLEIQTLGVFHTGHHRGAVAAVRLMDGPHNAGIVLLVFVRNGGGIVGGTVIHDQDLHLVAAL